MNEAKLILFIERELSHVCKRRDRNLKRPKIYQPLVDHDEGMIEGMVKILDFLSQKHGG